MKILLVTQYFYPENFKSNDIAFELTKKGHTVDVLTGIPNYPEGEYYAGYGLFRKRKEIINGVKVYRCFQTPRGKKAKGWALALNYISYAFFACFWAVGLSLNYDYDCVLVHEPSPITQALPAILLKKLNKIPFAIWVLDIWPDAMSSGGGIKNKYVLGAMTNFVRCVYNNSSKILISSQGFAELICKQGNYADKLCYYPNWADDIFSMPIKDIPPLPSGFRIMMAGNLGSAQTIKAVMEAARLTKDIKRIKWIFVGDGSERNYIEKFRKENHLEETVVLTGRKTFDLMPAYFNQADALLITLRAKFPHLRAVVPARLQSYMSAGKPIIGMIDGGAAALISEAKCGYVVPAEDYVALTELLTETILPSYNNFKQLGENGRKFYLANFTKQYCINNLECILSLCLRN